MLASWRRKRRILKLAKQICPVGSVRWIVANHLEFHISLGAVYRLWLIPDYVVSVCVEDKTGHKTVLWSSRQGLCTQNPTLISWVDEGVELLESEYAEECKNETVRKNELEAAIVEMYESRFKSEPQSTME